MSKKTQTVVLTRRMPEITSRTLAGAGLGVCEIGGDDPLPRETVLERVGGCAGVITMLSDRIDAEFLDAAGPNLKVVANYAVGYDNIDLDACRARGVRTSNTPGVLTEATADLAWALILGAARHVSAGDRLVRSGNWTGWAPMQLQGLELRGATLGIVGAGRIGLAVAKRSVGFGMRVLYTSRKPNADMERETGAKRVELEQLLAEADVVSLHVPLTDSTRQMIGREQLGAMKPTAVLVNTARGPVVDEAALVDALRTGTIAAAGLDVFEQEPRLTPGLSELPNVVLLPHLGSATTATRTKMAKMAAENVIAVLAGADPPNAIA